MNATSKDSTTDSRQPRHAGKPVSVYSLNFSELLSDDERKFLMEKLKPKKTALVVKPKTNARRNVHRGGAFLVVAIAAIAVFHFAFQLSFITREKAALTYKSVPVVPTEPQPELPVAEIPDNDFDIRKAENVSVPRVAVTSKPKQVQLAQPAKPQIRKREPAETRAERLRRAERLLTGV